MSNDSPSIAGVWNVLQGGPGTGPADEHVAADLRDLAPEVGQIARDGRAFIDRATAHLARRADQALDVGAGLLTATSTHHVMQQVNPQARVVYVDNDPIAAARAARQLEGNDQVHYIAADLRYPQSILRHATVTENLDFTRPILLIQGGTLHHVEPPWDPWEINAAYVDALCPGSFLALWHFFNPNDGSPEARLALDVRARLQQRGMPTGTPRTLEEIERFFGIGTREGSYCELLDPGLVAAGRWYPHAGINGPLPPAAEGAHRLLLCGVGEKSD